MGHRVRFALRLVALLLLTGPAYADPPGPEGPEGPADPPGPTHAADTITREGQSPAATQDRRSQRQQQQAGRSDNGSARHRPRIARARQHFDAAHDHYRRGEYRKAAIQLNRALAHDPDGKDLVYNLGLVHEKLGEIGQSIAQFRRLVRMETDSTERERIQRVIRRLEGVRAVHRRVTTADQRRSPPRGPPPTKPRPPSDSEPLGRLDGWVIGAGAVSVAAAASAIALGVAALAVQPGSAPAPDDEPSNHEHRAHTADARALAVGAGVSIGASAVAGAAAALLYFGREPPSSPVDCRCAATFRPRTTAITVSLRF